MIGSDNCNISNFNKVQQGLKMAKRPVFLSSKTPPFWIKEEEVEFKWHSGFAVSQKQKSIAELHKNAKQIDPSVKILEISSKSPTALGVKLSAFNLGFFAQNKTNIAVENIFQGSKVFEKAGPFNDLYLCSPIEAKRDIRLKKSGELTHFQYESQTWPLIPITAFYDWIYINALIQNGDLAKQLLKYDAFTDIEFNPKKSLNCQAKSAALFVSLHYSSTLDFVLQSPHLFIEHLKEKFGTPSIKNRKQPSLF